MPYNNAAHSDARASAVLCEHRWARAGGCDVEAVQKAYDPWHHWVPEEIDLMERLVFDDHTHGNGKRTIQDP